MKLGEAIKLAAKADDPKLALSCAEFMRFKLGLSYFHAAEIVEGLGVPIATWDQLLYRAEDE